MRWKEVGSLQSYHSSNKSSRTTLCPLSAVDLYCLKSCKCSAQILTNRQLCGGSVLAGLMEAAHSIIFSRDFDCLLFCQRFLLLPNSKEVNVQTINKGKWRKLSMISIHGLSLGNYLGYFVWPFKILWSFSLLLLMSLFLFLYLSFITWKIVY